jgi:hypothetical protein
LQIFISTEAAGVYFNAEFLQPPEISVELHDNSWSGSPLLMFNILPTKAAIVTSNSGRPWHGWEDCVKMDFKEIGCEDVDWVHLAQDR